MKRIWWFFLFLLWFFSSFVQAEAVKPSSGTPEAVSKSKAVSSAPGESSDTAWKKIKNTRRKVVIMRDLSSLDEVVKTSKEEKQRLQKDIQLYLEDKDQVFDRQKRQPSSAVDFEEEYEIRWDR